MRSGNTSREDGVSKGVFRKEPHAAQQRLGAPAKTTDPQQQWLLPFCVFRMWNTHVLDDNVRHVCDTCFDKGKSESCLVKAPATHASESVLVVGELLCTGVQANTERHTRNETREMCSCWGYKQHRIASKSTFLKLFDGLLLHNRQTCVMHMFTFRFHTPAHSQWLFSCVLLPRRAPP